MKRIFSVVFMLCFSFFSLNFAAHADSSRPQSLQNVANYVLSPTGNRIAVINTDGTAFLWNWKDNNHLVDLEGASFADGRYSYVVWSPDERYVAASCANAVRIWDTTTGKRIHDLSGIWDSDGGNVVCQYQSVVLAFSPDSTRLAVGHFYSPTVTLWNIAAGEISTLVQLSDVGELGVEIIQFGDNDTLLIASLFSTEVWDIHRHQRLQRFPSNTLFGAIALSPDGTKLAIGTGTLFSNIEIFDVNTGEKLDSFKTPLQPSYLQWTSDSQILIANITEGNLVHEDFIYVGQSIRTWNVSSGKLSNIFSQTTPQSLGIDLKPNEVLIGIGNIYYLGHVLIWNDQTDEVYHVETSSAVNRSYDISRENAYSLSLNPDNTLLGAVVGNDLIIWDFASGKKLMQITANQPVWAFDFISNDEFVYLTADHSLRLESIP